MAPVAEAVTVSLEDLKSGTVPIETLQQAFGPSSLGILVVKDVPPEYTRLRHRVLSNSSYLANLTAQELAKLECPSAKYLTGWSLGKEELSSGRADTLKGSFYANCAFYVDPSLTCATPTGDFSEENFPEYLSANVWPPETSLPGFRKHLEELCRCIIDVAVLVARACDDFAVREIEGYPKGYLEKTVRTSMTTKARLLHYFPVAESDDAGDIVHDDDWCAMHVDHGCLTGLTSAMFVDETVLTQEEASWRTQPGAEPRLLDELTASPDPSAGLHIKDRTGEIVQIKIPRDCLAFQTGEALELITDGRFKAVPHFVRAGRLSRGSGSCVARNTLAVFTQPNLADLVDIKQQITFGDFARGIVAKNTVG